MQTAQACTAGILCDSGAKHHLDGSHSVADLGEVVVNLAQGSATAWKVSKDILRTPGAEPMISMGELIASGYSVIFLDQRQLYVAVPKRGNGSDLLPW